MTNEEILNRFEEAIPILRQIAGSYGDVKKYYDAMWMAIEALNIEQQIIENGYTGKEMQIRIGGRLFAVRELAQ